jgi:hypothetical protein
MRDHHDHPTKIRRWFKGWAATAVIAAPLHHSQIELDTNNDNDGKVYIQIEVYNNDELKSHFALFGNYSWGDGEDEPEIG